MAEEIEVRMDRIVQSKDTKELMQLYVDWSQHYDSEVAKTTAEAAAVNHAKVAAEFEPDLNCRVIDIGAGTGMSGAALLKAGFTNVDAIDGCSAMLDIARGKGIYKNLFLELIGEDRIHSFPTGSYRLAFINGSFIAGHFGAVHLRPMAKAVVAGGHVVFKIRNRYKKSENTEQTLTEIQKLENEGVLVKVETRRLENSVQNEIAYVFVLRVL